MQTSCFEGDLPGIASAPLRVFNACFLLGAPVFEGCCLHGFVSGFRSHKPLSIRIVVQTIKATLSTQTGFMIWHQKSTFPVFKRCEKKPLSRCMLVLFVVSLCYISSLNSKLRYLCYDKPMEIKLNIQPFKWEIHVAGFVQFYAFAIWRTDHTSVQPVVRYTWARPQTLILHPFAANLRAALYT